MESSNESIEYAAKFHILSHEQMNFETREGGLGCPVQVCRVENRAKGKILEATGGRGTSVRENRKALLLALVLVLYNTSQCFVRDLYFLESKRFLKVSKFC